MNYTDPDLVSAYLGRTLSNSEQLALSVINPAIKRFIDNFCGKTFAEVEEDSRYYDGGYNSLNIDACTDITAVVAVNDDLTDSYDYTDNTEYVALPINNNVKTELRKRGSGCWPSGIGRIKVTAKFSAFDGGVPEDIQTAATKIASDIVVVSANASSGIASESLEGHSITYANANEIIDKTAFNDPLVKAILEQHRELSIG